jgi:hypothetical protein
MAVGIGRFVYLKDSSSNVLALLWSWFYRYVCTCGQEDIDTELTLILLMWRIW